MTGLRELGGEAPSVARWWRSRQEPPLDVGRDRQLGLEHELGVLEAGEGGAGPPQVQPQERRHPEGDGEHHVADPLELPEVEPEHAGQAALEEERGDEGQQRRDDGVQHGERSLHEPSTSRRSPPAPWMPARA